MKKAFEIALGNILNCVQTEGIIASTDHFSDFWARDSFYASWGLLETGEFEKVKNNLKLFVRYQRKNGHVPRRIDRFFTSLNYLGIRIKRKTIRPKYGGAYVFPALDPNILFIITSHRYFTVTKDCNFLRENFHAIHTAILWLQGHEKDGFLEEGLFANWMDVIVKTGKVFYTNVLYAEALKNFSEICAALDKHDTARTYAGKYQSLKEEINTTYWSGNYYSDWIRKNKKYDYFSTDGNILAMLFGISNQEQNREIIGSLEKFRLGEIPLKTNYPNYPWWRVALRMHAIGMPGYQNNFASWLWLGCVYAVALQQVGYADKAGVIYDKITAKIEEYQMVYEIYAPSGKPYQGWCWQSAASFAWSSGLYLWMHKNLNIR